MYLDIHKNDYDPWPVYRYKPTRLWGFSGHVQTIIHSVIGRVRCPWPIGERVYIGLPDETTLTYDLYQPLTNGHEGIVHKLISKISQRVICICRRFIYIYLSYEKT